MTLHRLAPGFMLLLVVAATCARAEETSVKLADCPEAVRKTFLQEARPTKIETVNKTIEDGETSYWVKTAIGSRHFEIRVNDEGTLISMELEVKDDVLKYADCPAAVKTTLAKESNNGKFEEVGKGMRYGVTVYDTVTQIGGKEYSFVVTESGTLVEKMLVVIEDEIELSHCPASVQLCVKEHATSGKVVHIMRSTGLGGHVYEVDVEIAGKTYMVEITEGGSLISKTLINDAADDEMDEKPAAKKDGKKEEKKEDKPAEKK